MRRYTMEIKGKEYVVDVQELSANQFRVFLGYQALEVHISSDEDLSDARITPEIIPAREGDEAVVERPSATYRPPDPAILGPPPKAPSPALPTKPHLPSDGLPIGVIAPMPGVIQAVEVKVGEQVKRGQTVVILEAMKMKNAIRSPREGVIAEVLVQSGQSVGYGDVLVKFEEGHP
jgi:glutaconyl-CoA/methylmalonyl-CoA decarboxylase subunit gamma